MLKLLQKEFILETSRIQSERMGTVNHMKDLYEDVYKRQFNYCAAGDDDPTTMQIKRACKEFKPTDTFPESFYSSIAVSYTHLDVYKRQVPQGEPVQVRTDRTVNFNWIFALPHPALDANCFSVVWTGSVVMPLSLIHI